MRTRPSVSSLLTSLERSGYIKRVRDKKDKRAVHIALRQKERHIYLRLQTDRTRDRGYDGKLDLKTETIRDITNNN